MKALPWALAVLAVAALAVVPFTLSPVLVQFGISTLLLAVLAQGWNIIGGFTGYASFGNSVFYGLGTYGTAVTMTKFHQSFALGLVVGAVVSVGFALLLGLPVLRLRGHYFAITTLALSEAVAAIIANLGITGRNTGLILPLIRGDSMFYEMSLALMVLATLTVWWLARSRFGFGLIAIREREDAAEVMGIPTTRYKVLAFGLAALFSALAGGIHAYWITFIDPASAFDISLNVRMIIMAVFGGAGTVIGPVVGAFLLSGVAEVLASTVTGIASLFFGLVIIAAVVFTPSGVIQAIRRLPRRGLATFLDAVRETRL
ncbi:MAG TPA: branched-chain amino acid ABC transporter permease [Trueperaceae bacterium]|nr:branched-chain amino acid ABC transporter permease [Trueperaceae bacterium]